MATQDIVGVPFSASQTPQLFKLLELPAELLALLESDNPPVLTITSTPPTATTPGCAILCSGSLKYQMRQQNTSNPIMVLHPSTTRPTPTDDPATFIPTPSICSIASIEDTIELIVQEEDSEKAPVKVNKWHEKFAKSRTGVKEKD